MPVVEQSRIQIEYPVGNGQSNRTNGKMILRARVSPPHVNTRVWFLYQVDNSQWLRRQANRESASADEEQYSLSVDVSSGQSELRYLAYVRRSGITVPRGADTQSPDEDQELKRLTVYLNLTDNNVASCDAPPDNESSEESDIGRENEDINAESDTGGSLNEEPPEATAPIPTEEQPPESIPNTSTGSSTIESSAEAQPTAENHTASEPSVTEDTVPTTDVTTVFQFAELRAPFAPGDRSLLRDYIYDTIISTINDIPARVDTDFQTYYSPSPIGKLVYTLVFCAEDLGNPGENLSNLLDGVINALPHYEPFCPTPPTNMPPNPNNSRALSITELERQAYFTYNGLYYLLPQRLDQVEGLTWQAELARALGVMRAAARAAPADFNKLTLMEQLKTIFGGKPLRQVVFTNGFHTADFIAAKRTLFDTLYLLYILRRKTRLRLDFVFDGLRALHVLEALAIDSALGPIVKPPRSTNDQKLKETLEALYPELVGWNAVDPLASLPLIGDQADFLAYFNASPVIHPLFARLHGYKRPFNDLKPIGIADLKVVKQWLVDYIPGEISHIETVLKGETKERTHRRLEKTEEVFSFASDTKTTTLRDNQTTQRYELKDECENVVKTNLALGANASLTYTYGGGMLVVNAGATFGYQRDSSETSKASDSFWKEIVSRALDQVERNVSERRSTTMLFETEETNKHGFNNKGGTGHINGFYRWIDKQYQAQLFNYGKRLMFEFIIPEPSAFFVEARLRAYQATLECPQPPSAPTYKTLNLGFQPTDINESKFQALRLQYDLSDTTYPLSTRWVDFVNADGQAYFKERGLDSAIWQAKTYNCKLEAAKGYSVNTLRVTGRMHFWGKDETDANEQNTFEVYLNGQRVVQKIDNSFEYWVWQPVDFALNNSVTFASDDVSLMLGFWDIANYEMSLQAELKISAQALLDWQTMVYNRIRAIEQQRVDKENQEIVLAYNTRLAQYRNRLSELKAMTANDLLQGQSEAFNRQIILSEMKKHCLTLLMKEFDFDPSDDAVAKIVPMKIRSDSFAYPVFSVQEGQASTTCGFNVQTETVDYPAIDIDLAKQKGQIIQFLEQAFEWQQLAYIFYPYFWAEMPKWIEMMNRHDDADSNLSAFLQAGSARVALAVTPAYGDAVLHYLATGEPWDGGLAPVIGDPLFIPLYDEIRKQQDDLLNATPEGDPWTFNVPTSLIYLDENGSDLVKNP